jgi:hypothetical protein
MKQEIKTPFVVVVVVLVLCVVGYFGIKAGGAGTLDQGQVKYTPGKPPWEETDPSKKGPGSQAPPGVAAPIVDNRGQ